MKLFEKHISSRSVDASFSGEGQFITYCKFFLFAITCFVASNVTAHYSNLEPTELVQLILFGLALGAGHYLATRNRPPKREIITWVVFSLALSTAMILGFHIVIEGPTYDGSAAENYISAYSAMDIVALVLTTVLFSAIFIALFAFLKTQRETCAKTTLDLAQPPLKKTVLFAFLAFAMFMPYFLVYFPGFIFGDSISSLQQIQSGSYTNHMPFLYTQLIRLCLKIGSLLGFGRTAGCALYSLIQMALMAFCFSYMTNWITTRCGLNTKWTLIIVMILGLSPYIATYSIAMWKDPLFSCAVVIASLQLADYVFSSGKIASSKPWTIAFATILILVGLLRSNGVIILAALVFIALITALLARKHPGNLLNTRTFVCVSSISLVLCLVVTGPLYGLLGVGKASRAETVGVPLNQMARVVALNGSMSESDADYMNELFPVNQYASQYTPTCTDNLKWSEEFNDDAIDYGKFFTHWASMLVRNPVLYFEAWELQTFGFWAVNSPDVNTYSSNILGGVPRNISEEYSYQLDELEISCGNLLGSDFFRLVFPSDGWSIPIGFIHWAIIWLVLCLFLLNRKLYSSCLVPSLGLMVSLILASPIWYWPRYGAPEQFLIPFYVCLLFIALTKTEQAESS